MGNFPKFKEPPPSVNGVYICSSPTEDCDADSRAGLELLNRLSREQGWRAAILATQTPGFINYVGNPKRLIFLQLLPLTTHDAILEIGPGLGQFSIAIAQRVATLDALEVVPGQAEFCAERYRQEGAANIRVAVGGHDCTLPYEDGAFDGIVLNLVLEWCAQRAGFQSHRNVHKQMLAECARVLKPGGFLYLVTKNRFSLRLLTGGRDEHMFRMRFGSALPRWFARVLCRARPPGYLHSHRELAALLRSSGFVHLDSYWSTPEMRWPDHLIRFDTATFSQERIGVPQAKAGERA